MSTLTDQAKLADEQLVLAMKTVASVGYLADLSAEVAWQDQERFRVYLNVEARARELIRAMGDFSKACLEL